MSQPAPHCLLEPCINRPVPGKLNDLRKRFEHSHCSGPPQQFGLTFGGGGRASGLHLSNDCHSSHTPIAATRPSSVALIAERGAANDRRPGACAVLGRPALSNVFARRSHFADGTTHDVTTEQFAEPKGTPSSCDSGCDVGSSCWSCDEVDLPIVDCDSRIGDCDSRISSPSMLGAPAAAIGRPSGISPADKRHLKSNGAAAPSTISDAAASSCGAAAVTKSSIADDLAAASVAELPPSGTVALTSKLFEKKPLYPSSSQVTTTSGRPAANITASSPGWGVRLVPPPRRNHVGGTNVVTHTPVAAESLLTGTSYPNIPAKIFEGSHQHDLPGRPLAGGFPDSEMSGNGAVDWRSELHDVASHGNSHLLEAALRHSADSWPCNKPSEDGAERSAPLSYREPAVFAGSADEDSRTAAQEEWGRRLRPQPIGNKLPHDRKQDCSNRTQEKAAAAQAPQLQQWSANSSAAAQQSDAVAPPPPPQQLQRQSQTNANMPSQQSGTGVPPPKPPRTFEHDMYVHLRVKAREVGNAGMRSPPVRPKSVAEIGHHRSLVDGHHNSDDDLYDDVVFAGDTVGELPDRGSHPKGLLLCQQPVASPELSPHRIADVGGGVSARAMSEGDDGTADTVGRRRSSADRESSLADGNDSRLSSGSVSNARKAALPKKPREGFFARNKILAPLVGLNPMKRYASEDCLSTAAKADGANGGRVPRAGTRWPTIDEAGSAMMSQVSGKVLSESADWSRERRNNQGRKMGFFLSASNGMLRAGSHGDVSRAGVGDSSLPPKSPIMIDMAKIHSKLNGAFAVLGGDRRACLWSFDDETLIEVGQDATIEDCGKTKQKGAGPARDDGLRGSANDMESAAIATQSDAPDQEVLQKRLKHCISVKQCSVYASASKVREFAGKAYPQLYQYALVVSLRKNPETNQYEPYVLFKFPPHIDLETTGVPKFCFPDAQGWQRVTEYRSETFTFVLTEGTGIRQYGYCRRFLPPSKGNVPRIPEVVCLVSPLSAFKFYLQVLDEIERRRRISTAEEFLQAAYGKPLPKPGEKVAIRAMMDVAIIPWKNRYGIQDDGKDETELVTFARSEDARIDGISYESLLRTLTSKQIVTCFAAILLERKIVFCAEKLSTLSSCVNALVSLVYPFAWQHTFIPVLPPAMIEVACSPTPFIIGLLSSNLDRLLSLEMDEVLVVNLDSQKFLVTVGDETDILPKQLHKALCLALDLARADSKWRDTFVSETFLRFFFETVGNVREFFTELEDGERVFEKERLISAACDGNRTFLMGFLEWFTETQMFDVYIIERLSDPQLKSTSYDEKFTEWAKDYAASLDQPPVQQSFFKSIISRARVRK